MSASRKNLLIVASLVVFGLALWILRSPGLVRELGDVESASGAAGRSRPGEAGSSGSLIPDAANVRHSVRMEIDRLREQVEAAPADTAAIIVLARLLHDAHQLEEAVTWYRRYVENRPTNTQAWLDLANSYALLGEWDRARDASESLLVLIPDFPAAMYNLGATHANQGNIEEAAYWWKKVSLQREDSALADLAVHSLDQIGE